MSSLMGLGTRAMFANMATLQSIGNNIANANTKGYSRQETQLETAGGQFTGAGFFGQGVNITTISRSYDRFLTTQSAAAQSVARTMRRAPASSSSSRTSSHSARRAWARPPASC